MLYSLTSLSGETANTKCIVSHKHTQSKIISSKNLCMQCNEKRTRIGPFFCCDKSFVSCKPNRKTNVTFTAFAKKFLHKIQNPAAVLHTKHLFNFQNCKHIKLPNTPDFYTLRMQKYGLTTTFDMLQYIHIVHNIFNNSPERISLWKEKSLNHV